MARPTLIVFARAPAIGVGKTRLARDIGAVEAWRLYRAMSDRLIRRLADPRWRLVVRLAGRGGPWRGAEPQGDGDLGARLVRALRDQASGAVAVIGTDAPDVTPAKVWAGLCAARRSGAALGPALDGGFWLLALSARRARRVDLAGVRWSSADTLADTLRVLGGRAAILETLTDIDDGADLAAWRQAQRLARTSIRRAPAASASSVVVGSPNLR